jgi:transcription elongation factor GreA
MPVDQARSLYKHMTGLTALSDAWKHAAIQSLLNVRSDLRQRPEEEERPPLFVTAESLREKQSELQRIRTEDIPANSKDIQIAREHGDLSENAEYKAAKERQELLHRRAEELQELIDRARPIVPEAIKGDVIAPGTRARLRNLGSQQEESFTFLGMWDADPDNGIISYLSPIGQQLLRHRVGETQKVKLPSGDVTEYEILAIEKAI